MSFDLLLVELFGEIANAAVEVAIGILVHIVLRKIGKPCHNIRIALLLQANTAEDVVHGLLHYFIAIKGNVVRGRES